jgi:hypothetical protein
MLKRICSVLALAAIASTARPQGITVSQSVDKSEVAFEDSVLLEYVITWPGPQSAYLFERPIDPDIDGFRVGKFSSTISTAGTSPDETTSKRLTYTLLPTSSGQGQINPVTIEYLKWPDSVPGQLVTEAMSVWVASPKPKETTSDEGWLSMPLMIAVLAIIAIGGVVVGVRVAKNRRPQEVVRSPKDEFLERLTELKQQAGADLKQFQTGLHRLLSSYMAAEYSLDVTNKSAGEIARAVEESDMPVAHREKLLTWLARAEKEKYSPVAAAPGETVRLESEVRTFFENM